MDNSHALTESHSSMTRYVEFDECQDVLASLDQCVMCLEQTERSNGAWKWVILSLHSALQGAMVCHLSGTAQVGALTSRCATKWHEWYELDRRGETARLPTNCSRDSVRKRNVLKRVADKSSKSRLCRKSRSRDCIA